LKLLGSYTVETGLHRLPSGAELEAVAVIEGALAPSRCDLLATNTDDGPLDGIQHCNTRSGFGIQLEAGR